MRLKPNGERNYWVHIHLSSIPRVSLSTAMPRRNHVASYTSIAMNGDLQIGTLGREIIQITSLAANLY